MELDKICETMERSGIRRDRFGHPVEGRGIPRAGYGAISARQEPVLAQDVAHVIGADGPRTVYSACDDRTDDLLSHARDELADYRVYRHSQDASGRHVAATWGG